MSVSWKIPPEPSGDEGGDDSKPYLMTNTAEQVPRECSKAQGKLLCLHPPSLEVTKPGAASRTVPKCMGHEKKDKV